MAVIINDFEVVTEPLPSKERGGEDSQKDESSQAQGPTPHEIERVIKHEMERASRLRAH